MEKEIEHGLDKAIGLKKTDLGPNSPHCVVDLMGTAPKPEGVVGPRNLGGLNSLIAAADFSPPGIQKIL